MVATRCFTIAVALVVATFAIDDAQARRLGGGGGAGLQRTMPARPATAPTATPPTTPPATPVATPTPAAPMAAAPAPAPRRSWLGPIAGLAAGLGIAALMSHLGLGAELGSLLIIGLIAFAAIFVVRALVRRSSDAPTPAYAGLASGTAGAGPAWGAPPPVASTIAPSASTSIGTVPEGFDVDGFARTAKAIFLRLQAANDAGALDELRAFATPALYAKLHEDIAARGGAAQRTDVVRLDAEVIDVATEGTQQVVSVRFHGLVREAADALAEPFDELWHLVRPLQGDGAWAIAGIQQPA